MLDRQNEKLILKTINQSRFPLLVSHEKPDGDSLGASLALSQYMAKNGKDHKYFCIDKPPSYFNFLPRIENIISDAKQIDLNEHDLLIAVDCGSTQRMGMDENLIKTKKDLLLINIDHHRSNNYFGHHNLVMPEASSTSEIIYKLFDANQINIDKYMATNLLTGILSDTMNFTNAATTKDSLKIASELLKLGARTNQILNNLTQNKNLLALKLWGKIFDRIEIQQEYNFAYVTIDREDLEQAQIQREGIDGLANFLSTLRDADFILVLTEEEDEFIKGSLRTTKDGVDLAKIAQALGGGGHKKAAGFKIEKKLMGNGANWKNFIINAIINELNKTWSKLIK
jgi:phosphoesterase RecJ-like protein